MSLWQSYLTQKLIDDNHPLRRDSNCLNSLQTKEPCTLCKDCCPNGVFDLPDPDWSLCDNCAVCAAICPTRCISPSAIQSSQLLELCRRITDGAALACPYHEGPADAVLPCLSAYPWELLAFFALQGPVHLLCGDCETCEKKALSCQMAQTLERLRSFLGNSLYMERVHSPSSHPTPQGRGFSRREAFSLLLSKTRHTAGGLLPTSEDLVPDGTLWRQLLIHQLRKTDPPALCRWQIPSFTESCNACGICAKLCPAQALHRVQDTEDPSVWYLAMIPWRCTSCGLCTQACPSGSITLPLPQPLEDPTQPILHKVVAAVCIRCGEPAAETDPSGLCPKCRSKQLNPLLW